jgi:uncharacterized repeat protein (TIGR03803 family)
MKYRLLVSLSKRGTSRRFGRVLRIALAWALSLAVVVPMSAWAQTFKSLYSFTGVNDGGLPEGSLIFDGEGNLYGTALYTANGTGNGTVYKLSGTGRLTVLYTFPGEGGNGANGARPYAGLVRDTKGNFYGTTYSGGRSGYGVVFRLSDTGKETVLHTFTGPPNDGAAPFNDTLLPGPSGAFYGTASEGGSGECRGGLPLCGVVFAVDSAGKETIVHNFQGGPEDGLQPWGNMVRDAQGNIYGTTDGGGSYPGLTCEGLLVFNCGTVFKLSPNSDGSWTESTFYNFTGGSDGWLPISLAIDTQGNLYGAATGGGSGSGILYKLDTDGKLTVLHAFTGGNDGDLPNDVLLDAAGNLYGTAAKGGPSGFGVVFKLDAAGKFTVLHGFRETDGKLPGNSLSFAKNGTLYGTTQLGGTSGWGTVFKIKP